MKGGGELHDLLEERSEIKIMKRKKRKQKPAVWKMELLGFYSSLTDTCSTLANITVTSLTEIHGKFPSSVCSVQKLYMRKT